MSRILCIWELGDHLGHLGQFFPIISSLLQKGHEIYFVVNNFSRIETFPWHNRVVFLPAPNARAANAETTDTYCFSDILLHYGYKNLSTLRPIVKAWQAIFKLIQPDLMIFDHAPTALLASRSSSSNCPRIIYSCGFLAPPPNSPPQNLHPWKTFTDDRIDKIENYVVNVINTVARDLDLQPIRYVSDLYSVDSVMIAGVKDIDFYRDGRENALYIDAFGSEIASQPYPWPEGTGKKIFAYLRVSEPQTINILEVLSKSNWLVLCFCAGLKADIIKKYRSNTMHFMDSTLNLNAILPGCDAVICHAGNGTINAALYHGCPMVLIPTQLEQLHASKLAENLQVANTINDEDPLEAIRAKINSIIEDESYSKNAKRLSTKYQTGTTMTAISDIAKLLEALMAAHKK